MSCKILSFCAIIISLHSCAPDLHNKKGVESAMRQYDHLIQKMDLDSIALLYEPDGDLGTMAHGRDSIRKFLAGFANYKVLSQTSVTKSIEINSDSSIQQGTYQQTVIVPSKDTVTVRGAFIATWYWDKNGWLIKRMVTKPAE